MSKSNVQDRIHTQFIIVVSVLLIGLVFYLVSPFIATLFIAAVITSAVNPIHQRLKRFIPTLWFSSFIMWLSIILLFVIPATFLLGILIKEAAGVSDQITRAASQLPAFIDTLPDRIAPYMPQGVSWQNQLNTSNLTRLMSDSLSQISSGLLKSVTNLVTGVSIVVLHLIIFLFALYYLLLDGERLLNYVKQLLPLAERQKDELVQKTTDLMHSIIYGLFGAAIAQGSLVGIGMALIGINNSIFWGAIAIALAPIPYVGVGLIWVPTTAWLFSTGQWGQGIFFLAWCLIFVINIDNIIKPYLIGARSLLHPFAVMLVILGGVLTLGFKGLIFGPLLLTLMMAFLHIYRMEFGAKTTDKK